MKVDLKDELLLSVEKPARYIGEEYGMIYKNPEEVEIRFAFCFPDLYEVGMSHLGMKILYHLLNEREDTYCERVFAPWIDMESKMKENHIPLFSLETKEELKSFDFVGFTLQYEMSYTNILNMLDLAQIPLRSKERREEDPIVIAGGPCAFNPEPLATVVDIFAIGESEELLMELMDLYNRCKKERKTKKDFLLEASKIQGIYVPAFYEVKYNEDKTIKSFEPILDGIPKKIKKRIIKNMEDSFYPTTFIVPFIETVHDRVTLELFRGCLRGCRFCQAGMIYRPVREKPTKKLQQLSQDLLASTGYEEISLTSLSSSDYSCLEDFIQHLLNHHKNTTISLPSQRVDAFNIDLMEKLQQSKKSSLTFAPEAGTQRLRDVINKNISEEDILQGCKLAFEGGWNKVKLYFMTGLPMETLEDIEGIAILGEKVVDTYFEVPKEVRNKGLQVNISTSCFVPKPFTPFQWEGQASKEEFIERQQYLKSKIKGRSIRYNYAEPSLSVLEAVVARGDRRVGEAIIRAFELGAKFDSWSELFQYEKWIQAFREEDIDINFYAHRNRSYEEILPWDHIDIGVTKEFLIRENEKAKKQQVSFQCREKCEKCGVTQFGGGVCYENKA